MNEVLFVLIAIAALLYLIAWKIGKIDDRLKETFPTKKEQDRKWAKDDPMGHWEAHKKEKK